MTPSQSDDEAMTGRPETELVLHEEELRLGTVVREHGAIPFEKRIEMESVSDLVERQVEQAHVDRIAANEGDSGEIETLADGSISIPVLEEELVITKRVVVRERIVVRKETTTEQKRVEGQLRKERVEIDRTET